VLIEIAQTYRGRATNEVLEAGEHEVLRSVGEYLIRNFSGAPFFAHEVEKGPAVETKPGFDLEVKPAYPAEVKAEAETEPVAVRPKPAVKKPRQQRKPSARRPKP
jgi:hypothetical protein